MHSTTLAFTILYLALPSALASANANALPGTPLSVSVPPLPTLYTNPGGHLACSDANFTGACQHYQEPVDKCITYTDRADISTAAGGSKITSVGPDRGQTCYFFDHEMCTGNFMELGYPGSSNLRGLRFDNVIRSWKCYLPGEAGLGR